MLPCHIVTYSHLFSIVLSWRFTNVLLHTIQTPYFILISLLLICDSLVQPTPALNLKRCASVKDSTEMIPYFFFPDFQVEANPKIKKHMLHPYALTNQTFAEVDDSLTQCFCGSMLHPDVGKGLSLPNHKIEWCKRLILQVWHWNN